jgi:hypothetical protein
MLSFILLGAYTARIELFKFFFFLCFGTLIWSFFMYYDASGSSSRKSKKRRAVIIMVVSAVMVAGMSVTWILSKTNMGWWFER